MISRLFRQISHQEIKKVAVNAMEEYKSFIFEVDSINTWLNRVLRNPQPVILQAYANFSLACRKITPILEKKAMLDEGKWHYARMDIEEVEELASALNIVKVPTLFLINKGNALNKIDDILTEEAINEFVEDAKLVAGLTSDETVFQGLLLAGEDFIKEKKYNEALRSFNEALSYKEFTDKYQLEIVRGLLQAYYSMGDIAKAKDLIEKVKSENISDPLVSEIDSKIAESSSKTEEIHSKIQNLKNSLASDPENHQLISSLALAYHSSGASESAIELALNLITKEKSFKGLGQKAIVQILNDLGPDHVLTKPARKKLQSLYIKFS